MLKKIPFSLKELIGEIDQDGNGCISFNEFLYLMTKSVHEDGDIEEEIREAFRVFDREGHGFITVPDLCQVLTTLGDKLSEGRITIGQLPLSKTVSTFTILDPHCRNMK